MSSGAAFPTKRLHIGNLPRTAQKADVQRAMQDDKDDIAEMWIARTPPGFGFVYVREDKAEAFVLKYDKMMVGDRPMSVAFATGSDRRRDADGGSRPVERDARSDKRRREDSRDRRRHRDDSRDRRRRRDDSRDRRRSRDDSRDRRRSRDDSRDRRRSRDDSRDRRRRRDDSRDRRRRRSPSTTSSTSSASSR